MVGTGNIYFRRIMETLKSVGETFKSKREEMHLSLKEVENATSIRQLYLQAIEEGRVSQFLSPVYAIGFIKQYAVFLGFDPDKLMKENPKAFQITSEKQDFAYGIGTLEVRGNPAGSVRRFPNLIWGGVVLLVLLGAWYFAKFLGVL